MSPDDPYFMGGVDLTPEEAQVVRLQREVADLEMLVGQMALENANLQGVVTGFTQRLRDQGKEMAETHTRNVRLEEQVLKDPTAQALDEALDRYNDLAWGRYDRQVWKTSEPYYKKLSEELRDKVAALEAELPPCDPKWMAKKIRGQRKEIRRLEKDLYDARKSFRARNDELWRRNRELEIRLRAVTPTKCP